VNISVGFPDRLKELFDSGAGGAPAAKLRVGLMRGAVAPEQALALRNQFRDVMFESLGAEAEGGAAPPDVLVIAVDANSQDVAHTSRLLPKRPPVVVILHNSDMANTRALLRAGAADVLPAPVGEAALVLCLERLLARGAPIRGTASSKPGQVVALLKAGGGVGATSLGVQAANLLSERTSAAQRVCFADLDLQFGAAALHFDLGEALTSTDCIAAGEFLEDTQFGTALAAHASGTRVLAAPRDVVSLDAMTPALCQGLIGGLRRDFTLTILDLPSVWTAWTNRALQLADRVALITRLSVPHVHMVRRQLEVLRLQKLDGLPLTLVCNAVSAAQQDMLSVKAAERAIGRPFDIVLPEDARVVGAAVNQGLMLSALRRGSKLEKSVAQFADLLAGDALVEQA
jgi:pilus assembly protein CpaE